MPPERLAISGMSRGVSRGGVGGGGGGGVVAGSCSLRSQEMYLTCGLMLKKKLLYLMIELVVILNHLGVINL